jgi:S1-C subfamily serine protease
MNGRQVRGIVTGLAATLAAAGPAATCRAASEYEAVLAKRSPGLVTLKYVLQINMGGMMGADEQEMDSEATGVMIDPKGLVICSNTQLNGVAGFMQRMMRARGMQMDVGATPVDIKILVGDDDEGLEADLVARDTELDLAWIRIADPGTKAFDHVDLKQGADPAVGEPVVGLRRLDRYFGRTAVLSEGRIGGITAKPRRLYVATGDERMSLGGPVFTLGGHVIGLMVSQAPDEEDAGMAGLMNMMSGMQEGMSGMILPAADVEKATRRALEGAPAKAPEKPGTPVEVKP